MTEVKDPEIREDYLPQASFSHARSFTPARALSSSDSVRWTNRYRRILLGFDTAVVVQAVILAHVTRFGVANESMTGENISVPYWAVSGIVCGAWLVLLAVYRSRAVGIAGSGIDEYKRVISATFAVMGLFAVLMLVFHLDFSRGYFAGAFVSGLVWLIVCRWLVRCWLGRQRRNGRYLTKVIILGRPKDVRHVAHQLQGRGGAAYQVVGAALTRPTQGDLWVGRQRVPVVADRSTLVDAVRRLSADAVIVAGPLKGYGASVQELGWQLEESATQLILTTGLTNVAGPRIHSRPVEGLPLMHVELPQYTGVKHVLKRALDIALSALALLVLLPVFAVLAMLIRRDSDGPAIFRQERVGRGGEAFTMYKFRSMVLSAEEELESLLDRNEGAGVLFKIQGDPRVTGVGRWLRKYSLDELPQFWNVLCGHMSLVGPRPPLPGEVARYGDRVGRRLYIKPGLTGMWQINGRSELNWKDGVRLDLYYVENWSLAGDLIILWRTFKVLWKPVGAY
ncbi:sugar transferase [Arthrobacter gengyunqii]|uniref:Sugar transferase n=1 Tax=Arthrobacter gengyunqii TaxID=2886940 RepID=A0A9X1M1L1_9MICC|nr:sugar transferase [Arthrobacter gengyunqii]MCC3269643.1 sugar transferase [Arthrobacter gengyunqii]UOY97103.1 sugar transferase [Arthrobacter gengyunqii]